ncbi:hypothetical protein BJX64DRAFT_263687 [Aspergillus heterothallicus]
MASTLPGVRRRQRKTSQEERICAVCSQAFKKAEHLARHFRSHTKERPFMCPVCGKLYVRRDTLMRHTRSQHLESDLREQPSNGLTSDLPLEPVVLEQPPVASTDLNNAYPPIPTDLPDLQCPSLTHDANSATISLSTHSLDHTASPPAQNICEYDDDLVADFLAAEVPSTREWPTFWSGQWEEDWTSLLTGDDFDLDAVNQTLMASTHHRPQDVTPQPASICPADESPPDSTTRLSAVQRRWHTFSETKVLSQRASPEPSRGGVGGQLRTHADDRYRQKLVESLRPRVQPGILPSTNFLDFCLQAYFSHFQAIFPLLHAPTFQPSRENAVLLLSMCSIGSLLLGSSKALAHGTSMFERLHKAILASWDTYIQSPNSAHLYAIQASVIGQTFGLLMGRPRDLVGIEFFHGTMIAWARKVRLFVFDEDPIGDVESLEDDSDALRLAWKNWARLEEKKRIVLALHIHDAELVKLHHHEPILRHALESLPQLSTPDLFAAPCPKSWKALFLANKQPLQETQPAVAQRSSFLREFPQNDFLSYAMLESIGALAYDNKTGGPAGRAVVRQCEEFLMEWYYKYAQVSNASKHPDHFCLMILWHSIFMHLETGFDQLECAVGREGEAAAQKNQPYTSSWAGSRAATRALLHATLIQQHFQLLPVGAEPAIHVPMALYNCGIAWACFTRFGSGVGDSFVDPATLSEFPEIKLFGAKQLKSFHDIRSSIQWGRSESSPMFKIINLLGKISYWKVAGSFATTLMALVDTQDMF